MPKVTYNNKGAVFFPSLKAAVEDYFKENNLKKTGNWALFTKTLTLIPAAIIMYVCLLTISMPALLGVFICIIFGFTQASIGFNVMHDANHGSYSTKSWVNNTLGLTLNMLGGNAFIWKQKHNIIHHTYTNVDGVDDDIAKSPFIRMCSSQQWKPAHRVQHLYLSFLYAISSIIWVLFQDFEKYFKQKVHNTALPKMSRNEHVLFWISKLLYIVFYIVLPIVVVGWQVWLVGFIAMHIGLGFSLAVVFQLAHVIEETEFSFVETDGAIAIENEWAIHQIKTTANFSPDSKIISWLVGGLNYQVEHHLFPRVSHIHYPALSKIVKTKCEEFGLIYNSIPTFGKAVISHYRFIRQLGKKPIIA